MRDEEERERERPPPEVGLPRAPPEHERRGATRASVIAASRIAAESSPASAAGPPASVASRRPRPARRRRERRALARRARAAHAGARAAELLQRALEAREQLPSPLAGRSRTPSAVHGRSGAQSRYRSPRRSRAASSIHARAGAVVVPDVHDGADEVGVEHEERRVRRERGVLGVDRAPRDRLHVGGGERAPHLVRVGARGLGEPRRAEAGRASADASVVLPVLSGPVSTMRGVTRSRRRRSPR